MSAKKQAVALFCYI